MKSLGVANGLQSFSSAEFWQELLPLSIVSLLMEKAHHKMLHCARQG
jgi:hypothetical protein